MLETRRRWAGDHVSARPRCRCTGLPLHRGPLWRGTHRAPSFCGCFWMLLNAPCHSCLWPNALSPPWLNFRHLLINHEGRCLVLFRVCLSPVGVDRLGGERPGGGEEAEAHCTGTVQGRATGDRLSLKLRGSGTSGAAPCPSLQGTLQGEVGEEPEEPRESSVMPPFPRGAGVNC